MRRLFCIFCVEERRRLLHDKREGCFTVVVHRCLELVGVEPNVVASISLAIDRHPVLEVVEVVPKLFSDLVLRKHAIDACVCAELLVQGICLSKRCTILSLEEIVVGLNIIEEYVGLQHHLEWTVCVVEVLTHGAIYLKAVASDSPKLEVDLTHEGMVVIGRNLVPRRVYIDKAPDDSRLCIGDLDRLVRAHE